jgi:hypothetical protein
VSIPSQDRCKQIVSITRTIATANLLSGNRTKLFLTRFKTHCVNADAIHVDCLNTPRIHENCLNTDTEEPSVEETMRDKNNIYWPV